MQHLQAFLKRLIIPILIISVMLFLNRCSPSYTSNSKQIMENLNIEAAASNNGDINITETWRVNLLNRDKLYKNLYKTFECKTNTEISNLSVYDIDQKKQYKFTENINPLNQNNSLKDICYIYKNDKETEIGWFMPPIESGVRTFKIQYTIKNIVDVYKDTSVIWLGFVGKKFSMPITELKANITLPNGEKLSKAWLHCTAESNLKIEPQNKVIINAKEIPSETFVETRILAPVSLFSNSNNIKNVEIKESIINEEKKQAEDWAKKQRMEYIVGIIDAAAGALFALIGLIALMLIKNKNKPYKVEAPEYTRDIPPNNSPAGVANLFYYYHGGVTDRVKGRIFSSTLLSLAHKGYVRFDMNEYKNFIVVINESNNKLSLTKSEEDFYEMISNAASNYNNQFSMEQFEAYAKLHSKSIDKDTKIFLSHTKREIANEEYFEKSPDYLTISSIIGTISLIAAICIFIFTQAWLLYIPIGAAFLGIMLIMAGKTKAHLSKKGEYQYAVWHGLKKYMLEFSRMTEYGVPELALWEEYLVYATMMGISQKVCEQLKIVYPQLNDTAFLDTNFRGTYMYYMFGNHMGMGGLGSFGNDFASYIGTTLTNISTSATRLAHPPASNNNGSSGGGFGGSGFGGFGGGFGSGGGGGAR